jgi:hypothetical protein
MNNNGRPLKPLAPPPPERFPLVKFNEIKAADGASYLVKGLIPGHGFVVIWGPPKCGKSFLAFDLMMHVALGWHYRDRRVKAGPVVYCALEGAEGFRARAEAFRQKKLNGRSVDAPFFLMASPLSLVADQAAFVQSIRAQLVDKKPVAVVIDTLNRSLVGSESDDKDMAAYVRAADAIRDAFTCVVVIVHHCGHGGERPRGHSSLMGALDTQIAVKRDAAENIVATLELSKDGPVGAEIVSRLEPVEVGTDEDGDAITSCVIEPTEARPLAELSSAKAARSETDALSRDYLNAYDVLADGVKETRGHNGRAVRKVNISAVQAGLKSNGFLDLDENGQVTAASRKALNTAKTKLLRAQALIQKDDLIWRP